MKKIIAIIICLFVFPVIVQARTIMEPYETIITATDGAVGLDVDGNQVKIPNGEILKVVCEYTQEGREWILVSYNNKYVFIRYEDAEPKNKNTGEQDISREFYTLKEVEMYQGPGVDFGTTNKKIPKDTIVKSSRSNMYWAYVEYEGVNGWIYYDNGATDLGDTVLNYVTDKEVLVFENEISIYEDMKTTKEIGKLAKGEYKVKYYINKSLDFSSYYVETESISGWIRVDIKNNINGIDLQYGTILSDQYKIIAFNGPKDLYAELNDTEPIPGIMLPQNTIVDSKYLIVGAYHPANTNNKESWNEISVRINYKGKDYWIKGDTRDIQYSQYRYTFILDADTEMYEFKNNTTSVIKVIPKGTKISYFFEKKEFFNTNYSRNFKYIEIDGEKGFIEVDHYNNVESEKISEIKEVEETITETKKEDETTNKLSKYNIISVILIIALLIILLVLKLKKKGTVENEE